MSLFKIKSYAKINLFLKIKGKYKSGLHKIETFVSLISLFDEIEINKIKKKKHSIRFIGKFGSKIGKDNSVNKLLKILEKNSFFKDYKLKIIIKKNIPTMSGLGGGSMNAATILRFLISKSYIRLNEDKVLRIADQIGSDVKFGLDNNQKYLTSNGKLTSIKKKLKLYLIIIKPNFGCSTKKIYRGVKNFKKSQKLTLKNCFNFKDVIKSANDLEHVVFKTYPIIKNIKATMSLLPGNIMVRMSGSGSSLVAYFKTRKASQNASKILKNKYKNYWCISSKTI